MNKIPTLYLRDEDNPRLVTREVNHECQWVLNGEGVATEKFDGTACLVRRGYLWKRLTVKPGKRAPDDWECTGTVGQHAVQCGPGWLPVTEADRWHWEVWIHGDRDHQPHDNGTYELVGPKVQGNPYGLERHELWRHGSTVVRACPTSQKELDGFLYYRINLPAARPIEGIVWHHPDGRMAKIKARDFGIPWPVKS